MAPSSTNTAAWVIVHAPVGGGHRAAAQALSEAAKQRGLRTRVLNLFDYAPPWLGHSYVAAHRVGQGVVPTLYGQMYFMADHAGGPLSPIRRAWDSALLAPLVDEVLRLAPSRVVATHHLGLVVLGDARRRGLLHAPLTGVVTDYTAHAAWAEEGVDQFCVGGARAAADLRRHGVSVPISVTGIPVRAGFGAIAPVRHPASGEPLRVLVTSGGFGVGPMRSILRSFRGIPDVSLTVVVGRDAALERRVQRYVARYGLSARVIGFERNMALRMQEAHVIVGKAGGLTVTESLSAGRPMIVVGTVPGNETANEEMILAGHAGFRSLPEHVGRVAAWLVRSQRLETMGRQARSLVPTHAADNVVEAVDSMSRNDRAA